MIKTEFLSITSKQDVERSINLLKNGELVAVPTETVYGLAADAKNVNAVKKIFIAKDRPNNHPLILHIDRLEVLNHWAEDISDKATLLAKHFWPGPLTLLFKKKDTVSNLITGGLEKIAIRIPQNDILREIIRKLDSGLVAPSANPHKKLSPTSAHHVIKNLYGKIAAVLDGGACNVGIESTILDITQETPVILRSGPISKKMIENVLGCKVDSKPDDYQENVPGNMKQHYQPNTKTILLESEKIAYYISTTKKNRIALMHYSDSIHVSSNISTTKISSNKNDYAKTMYNALFELDKLGVDEIIVECPPVSDEWVDVLDRLKKATG